MTSNFSILEDTPYHQGTFHVKLVLGEDYPNSPPKGYFITTIYHPNVHQGTGDICVDTLKKEWNSTNTLETIFTVIRCLLIIPNPDSALNSEAAHKFQYDNENFVKRAKLFTEAHAMPDQNENVAACNPVSSSSTSTKQSATEPAREISAINGNSQSVSGGPSALNSQKMKNSISSGNATGKLSIKVKRL